MKPALEAAVRPEWAQATPSTAVSVRHVPVVTGIAVLLASSTVLLGWATRLSALQTLGFGSVTMKANTAVGLAAAAAALLLSARSTFPPRATRHAVQALAVTVALVGGLTLAEYVLGTQLGIDELVFRAHADASLTTTPGRMAAVTAFAFLLLGVALLTLQREATRRRPAQILLVAVGALALTSLLGYVYGVIPTAGLGQGIQIAMPTAIALLLLAAGGLALHPSGWMTTVLSENAGGILARRLIPYAFLVPLSLGALRALGAWSGSFSIAMQSAIVAVLTMLAFGVLMWRTAKELDTIDAERKSVERERVSLVIRESAASARADAEHASRAVAEQARESAEQAAREKAEALNVLEIVLSNAPIGFALVDRDLRFLRVNHTLAAMHGETPDAHIGRGPRHFTPDTAGRLEELIRGVFETGTPVLDAEFTQNVPMGQGRASGPRHLLASCYPVPGHEEVPLAVGVVWIDTTERRELQQQLAHSQKMEAVGQLAGGVAHDFNNLLTVIMSYSALLLEQLGPADPHREDVNEISAAADRAAALTRQLLAFSRKQVLQPRVINLNDVITDVEKMLQRLIGEHMRLETTLDPGIAMIKADPGQVEQVLVNLVVNARDAMPEGGRIRIATSNSEHSSEYGTGHISASGGPYVMLTVSDTGTGMTPEVQQRLFEPFFTTKAQGQGTGLGLSTVYGIVKQSGGDIWLYSELGMGTTFKVYFPQVADGAAHFEPETLPAHAPRGSETILLVEDDDALRALAVRVLQRCGYTVLVARNGVEALAIAEDFRGRIDCIATDIVMPGMSGRALVDELLETRPDVAVLLMSGYTGDEGLRRGVLEDHMTFLQKPFTPAEFARAIRGVLDRAVARVSPRVAGRGLGA